MKLREHEETKILEAIKTQFKVWVTGLDDNLEPVPETRPEYLPQIVQYEEGRPAVVWESGAPYSWATKDPGGDVDEEFGFKIPARPELKGFYLEPINGYVLGIYREGR